MYFPLIHSLGDFLARTPSEQTERGRAGIGVGEGEENDPPIPTTVLPDMSYFEQLWGSLLEQAASTSLFLIAHSFPLVQQKLLKAQQFLLLLKH